MSSFSSTLLDLETLFIEKLQEKYKLNKKDLKRAFSKFDTDNNGLLDLTELTKGIQLFLNGVKESQVQQLVSKYDKNGDGKISYDELLDFLTNRTAIDIYDDSVSESASRPSSAGYSGDYRAGSGGRGGRLGSSVDSGGYGRGPPARAARAAPIYDDDLDRMTDDYDASEQGYGQANQPMAAYPSRGRPARNVQRGSSVGESSARDEVASQASSTADSEVPSTLNPTNPRDIEYRAKIFMDNIKSYLVKQAAALRMAGKLQRTTAMMPAAEMHESVARDLMIKAFQPYTGQGDGKSREQLTGVELPEFAKVLRSFKFPGAAPLRTETISFLFEICSTSPDDGDSYVNEEGRTVADPNILTDLLFGVPTSTRDIKARGLNKVGRTAAAPNVADSEGRPIKGFVAKLQSGRDIVGSGPVQLASAADAQQQRALDQLSVPLRFISQKSRTVLQVPSSFDPVSSIARSNQLPAYDLVRKHVFGMSGSTYSGNTIYALPSTPASFGRAGAQPGAASRSNPDFIDPACVVYAAAGLGVVHNLSGNTQHFFDAHTDDITCITVSTDGAYAATGQMGKSPSVHIWPTDITPSKSSKPLNTIGGGFFARGVCGLAFSYDNKYLVAIGCDDNHALGVFDTSTCALVAETPCQHGIPPQIRWLEYCPGQQHTEYITREHAGLCDLFASAGEHHLKIWSFRRPTKDEPASLKYKAGSIGKASAVAAKAYFCCSFVYCEDRSYDLVAGGSNGVVYLWRAGVVVATVQAFRSKVRCMVVNGDRVYCGGGGGNLKVLDARTLSTIQQFSLLPADPAAAGAKAGTPGSRGGARPSSAGLSGLGAGAPKPRPASAGPASRLAHRTQPIKSRAALSTPKHAAGQPNAQIGTAGEAISGAGMRGSAEEIEANSQELDEGSGAKLVTGIAVVRGTGRVAAQTTYLIVALGTGKCVRVDVGSALSSSGTGMTPRPGSASAATALAPYYGKDLFHYHTGPVYGLAADVSQNNRLFATVCDDRKLQVWDAVDCVLISKTAIQTPSRCCHMDKTSSFIAVGSTVGTLTVYYLADQLGPRSKYYKLTEVAFRKDAKNEVTEVKFAPSNERIAMGCRDDCIYVYSCEMGTVTSGQGRNTSTAGMCVLRAMHKLRGHSSTITHLDWSYDSQLIRSTCAAYELLCWEAESGKLASGVNVSDVKWKTHHCVLGFSVMGIWPPYADGTDINAVDAVPHKGIIATANDTGGFVRLHNYPCVVRNAPGKEYNGHSSHVMGLRFMRDGDLMMTCGGNDRSVVVWEVRRDESLNDADGFRR